MSEVLTESQRFRSGAARVCYIAYYVLSSPLLLLALVLIPLTWHDWPHRGVMEGPEPTDGEVISFNATLGVFALTYLFVFFSAQHLAGRHACLPFAVQLPALLALVVLRLCWSVNTGAAGLYIVAYLALLIVLLLAGIVSAARARPLDALDARLRDWGHY